MTIDPPSHPAAAPPTEASIAPAAPPRSRKVGDWPDEIHRRYLTAPEPSGLGLYVDNLTKAPAFRDHGKRLIAGRADPKALRDMALIAKHRGWTQVVIAGAPAFRREAWLALRTAGLDVRGYRPTARDLQFLKRRQGNGPEQISPPPTQNLAARSQLAVVEAVVKARIVDPALRKRALDAGRERIASYLALGAKFAIARIRPAWREHDRRR